MKLSLMSLVHTVADALSRAPVDSAERDAGRSLEGGIPATPNRRPNHPPVCVALTEIELEAIY
jgi:hypothetical protein